MHHKNLIHFLRICLLLNAQCFVVAQVSDFLKNTTYSGKGILSILKFINTGKVEDLDNYKDFNINGTLAPRVVEPDVEPVVTTTKSPEPGCGRRLVQHAELIVYGEGTKLGEWPWHVALYRVTRRKYEYICGGSLVSSTRVITAGHCVMEGGAIVLPERLFVILGKYNFMEGDTTSQQKMVHEIILHDRFSRNPLLNDISILKLTSQVVYSDFVQPICRWKDSNIRKADIFNRIGVVVGWGFNENNETSDQLAKARLPVVPDYDCLRSKAVFFDKYLTNETFCVGYRNGTNACNGDSGSGFYLSEKDEEGRETWYLRGLVSLSVPIKDIGLCDPYEYTIFTDIAQYSDFLRQNVDL